MNMLITCPHCQHEVSVPANVEAACPCCQERVIAEAPPTRSPAAPRWQFGFVMLVTVPWLAWMGWGAITEKPRTPSSAPVGHAADSPPAAVSRISNAELQGIIADVYKVETSRFIQSDLLWITLPVGMSPQKTCQAIANLWASRSGLDYVRVECWNGSQRLGQGTVQYGRMRTP